MAQLEFKCEKCGKLLRLDAEPGSQVTCTHCQATVSAPASLTSPGPGPQPQSAAPAAPRPQVMGGVRPQVAAGGPPPPPPGYEEEPEVDNSVLAAMSILMPWAVSFVFHLGLLLVLMFFTFMIKEVGEEENKQIIPSTKLVDDPGSRVLTRNPQVEQKNNQRQKTDLNKPAPDVMDKSAGKPQNITIAVPGGSSASGGSEALASLFSGGEAGMGSKFFGTESGGNVTKVVYVVDRSGSMFDTFSYVQAELARSIKELKTIQRFHIIFFADDRPYELKINGNAKLQLATVPTKKAATDWVDDQIAESSTGRTDPRKALIQAFEKNPELIYLLTDGLFPTETLDTIKKHNTNRKVRINTIAFKSRTGEPLLKKIATENGGAYKFISENQLGQDYD